MAQQASVQKLFRFLCFHNPFYLISATLMLFGFHVAFKDVVGPDRAWALIAALSGYILLLALTAYFVVQYGRVWEDARSIVLIIVLMFLALSVSFDQICNEYPSTAATILPLGLGLSVIVSEGLIRSLRLKFPLSYRLPYYVVLAIFFLYPLWLAPLAAQGSGPAIVWRVLAFPLICAVAFLTLLPAVWRGSQSVRGNGTPWNWAWYPWTVFGFLGFAVCLRSYVLTLSFQPAVGLQSSFSGYYLVPFFLSVLVLLIEMSVTERLPKLGSRALMLAPLLLPLAIPVGNSEVFQLTLATVVNVAGSPIWLALIALLLFYTYALLRGFAKAEIGLVAALLALTVIGPQTIDPQTLLAARSMPLSMLAITYFAMAFIGRCSWRAVLGSIWLTAAVGIGLQDMHPFGIGLFAAYHVLLICLLIIGYVFRDECAIVCHEWAACFLILSGVAALGLWVPFGVTGTHRMMYAAVLCSIAGAHWWRLKRRKWVIATVSNAVTLWLICMHQVFDVASKTMGPLAATVLAAGAVSFAIAAFISGWKGGGIAYLRRRWKLVWQPWHVEPSGKPR